MARQLLKNNELTHDARYVITPYGRHHMLDMISEVRAERRFGIGKPQVNGNIKLASGQSFVAALLPAATLHATKSLTS